MGKIDNRSGMVLWGERGKSSRMQIKGWGGGSLEVVGDKGGGVSGWKVKLRKLGRNEEEVGAWGQFGVGEGALGWVGG